MSARTIRIANLLVLAAFAAWGAWLLAMSSTKADYVAAQAGTVPLTCDWVSPSSPNLGSLGLSHEEQHSWTDRKRAWLAVPVPPLPEGGSLELQIVSLAGPSVEAHVAGQSRRYSLTEAGTHSIALDPLDEASVRVLVLDIAKLAKPSGQDRRWLGVAIGKVRACPLPGDP